MSTFKIILTTVFAISFVVGIILFAFTKSSSIATQRASLVVWGTISTEAFESALRKSTLANDKYINITYIRKDLATFDSQFVESLADGKGPDIIILREDSIHKHRNKVLTIPFESYSERDFKDKFIELGELFLNNEGVIGLPFIVDPMVMYWNRDMFSNALVSRPPVYWDEMAGLVEKITRRDSSANVLESTIALGEWRNINHAKEIVVMTLLQAGTPIVSGSGTKITSVLNQSFGYPINPSQSAISFYTQFSNPNSPMYSWNRSLPTSQNFFLSGNLATYIGFASEIFSIQQKNSNLNFDVTGVPQIRDTNKRTVFAHMYALSIVKQSKQVQAAFTAINALTEVAALKEMEKSTNLPPVRRDLLADRPSDAFRTVFYNSALISSSWIDPNPAESANTFRDMIESITSGRSRLNESLIRADSELNTLLK